ncbi:glycoside hydrolase family 30 beta sandwich domain-containing protein [Prevotella sp. 10(H)]|uniref:glycoside hydrolase family 30 protein n=1 Tax=Prevotella sp. 10(H) TaxID=1158294 RepID=UPI0004A6F7A3|nr:glycoside hydrolase family 30 protein [Prevotella sp. 10(H)]
MKKQLYLAVIILLSASCSHSPQMVKWVSTTHTSCFVENPSLTMVKADGATEVTILTDQTLQTVDGFGGCLNELGWVTISALNDADRDAVIKDLFSEEGMNFTWCRMPIGANDFSRDWYSYNETAGDFEMKNFSIANDKETLIPYIKAAQKVNPNLRVWASPWCPPTWMKYTKHYACKPSPDVNDLKGSPTTDTEGTNLFIQEPEYFKAYTLYFKKFLEAYKEEGINIEMVAPQNEFNSCQIFPSCTWTADALSTFIGDYLGPQMKEIGVRVMFGTMERPNHLLVDTIMNNKSGEYISEIGFQWAGKEAISKIHETYPDMKLMQTESECGNGQNSWEYCFYTWNLMKHYFNNGISAYMYWNISLDKDPANSRWKWAQNSLISVDQVNKTYKYNPEYYLMKQFSHFVKPGAKRLKTEGAYENLLAFVNPDNSTIVIVANENDKLKTLNVKIGEQMFSVDMKPKSLNTFHVPTAKS